jgi:hypothetical protein
MNKSNKKPILTLVKPVSVKKKVIVKKVKPQPKQGKLKMKDTVKPASKKVVKAAVKKPVTKAGKLAPKPSKATAVKKDQKKLPSKVLASTETVEKGTVKKLLAEIKTLQKEISRRDMLLKQLTSISAKHADLSKPAAKAATKPAAKKDKAVKPAAKAVKPAAKAVKPAAKAVKPGAKTVSKKDAPTKAE